MNTTEISSLPWILNGLLETCKDGQEGFHRAAEHVRSRELRSLFRELATQRQLYAGELQTLLRSLGEGAADSGTVAGALHRGWLNVKSILTHGDDHAILAECERGEDAAVAQYFEVVEHDDLPPQARAARTIVRRQLAGLQRAHDRIRALRDRAENEH